MKVLNVSSLPIDKVMMDIAEQLQAPYTCECDEYFIEIPATLGSGIIYGIMLDDGMGLINYEVELKEDLEIHFTKDEVHPIKYIFCYSGIAYHHFANEMNEKHEIKTYQNVIVASEKHNGHILCLPAGIPIKLNSLEINRAGFKDRFHCPVNTLPESLQLLFADITASQAFFYSGQYSLQISDVINNMRAYQGNGFLRRMFLEAKGYELFALQLAQYIDDGLEDKSRTLLRRGEIDAVIKAGDYLKAHLGRYITTTELSNHVALNVNKLQAGFNYLYGKTINNFIQDYRLEEASRLLLGSEYNISEIAEMVGIHSKSYFAKVFKEKYGVTPKKFQTDYRNIKQDDGKT